MMKPILYSSPDRWQIGLAIVGDRAASFSEAAPRFRLTAIAARFGNLLREPSLGAAEQFAPLLSRLAARDLRANELAQMYDEFRALLM